MRAIKVSLEDIEKGRYDLGGKELELEELSCLGIFDLRDGDSQRIFFIPPECFDSNRAYLMERIVCRHNPEPNYYNAYYLIARHEMKLALNVDGKEEVAGILSARLIQYVHKVNALEESNPD